MRLSFNYLAIVLISVAGYVSCDSAFMGSGGAGLGDSNKFKNGGPGGPNSGDGNPFGPNGNGGPGGPGGPGDPFSNGNPNDPNSPFGDGGGNNDNNGLNGGGGDGETVFSDATVTVLRADGSSKGEYNHTDVTLEFKVGSKSSGVVSIGKKGVVESLEGVCTAGKAVAFDLIITHKGRTIKPNKSAVGGILAKRLDKGALQIGYEYHALGQPGEEASPDNNDDIIFTLRCDAANDSSSTEVEINVNQLCIDPRINLSTWLSPSSSQNLGGRSCTGT